MIIMKRAGKVNKPRSELNGGHQHNPMLHWLVRKIYAAHNDGQFNPERISVHNTSTSM